MEYPYIGGTRKPNASSDPGWDKVWRRLTVVSPWSVGSFPNNAGADRYGELEKDDLKYARAMGLDYMPVVFPGFSSANLHRANLLRANLERESGRAASTYASTNVIPRACGRFFWRQVHNARLAGATILYGAMFDEVNEGTAIYKILPHTADAPTTGILSADSFVTMDADGCDLPSDWYLRLAGAATTVLRNNVQPSQSSPDLPFPLPPRKSHVE